MTTTTEERPKTLRSLLPFLNLHSAATRPPEPSSSVSGAYAPAPGKKVAAAPALAASPRAPLRSGVGMARTPVPTVAHAPGTVPYFPPEKPAPKVAVTEQVYRPWSFAVTDYGIHGKEVPRTRRHRDAAAAATSASGTP